MRAFFALPVEQETASAIDRWRTNSLPAFERPVVQANFHVTLAFLNEISDETCRSLENLAAGILMRPFSLELDSPGYWPKQGIYFLEPSNTPDVALDLADQIRRSCQRLGIRVDRRDYLPHLTLARRCETAPPHPLSEPDFRINCDEFCLYQSIRGVNGVRYEKVSGWPLL